MRIKNICLLVSLVLSAIFTDVNAQTGTIRGFVHESETGEPMMYTNVYLKGTTIGAATDQNGFYNISRIPVGSYTLMITTIGYDTLREPVTVKDGDIQTLKLFLKKGALQLQEVNVTAKREEARNDVRISVTKISAKEISLIPAIGGQPDIAQYLAVLPGVISTGDQGGQLYIRGGSPIQNKVLLDGMTIYNPFHSIGIFSVFDMDIIRNADIYTGGFNAQYGGRISSIMDITTKDGNKSRIAGLVGASPFGSRAILEGPINFLKKKTKDTEESGGSATFLLSGKNSFLDKTSKTIYKYANKDGLPFYYSDLYGKLSFATDNGSKINFFGFNFDDKVHYEGISDFNWNSKGGGTNFLLVPEGSSTLFGGTVAFSDYKMNMTEEDGLTRMSQINGFNVGFNFSSYKDKNTINYGFDMAGYKTNFEFYNSVKRKIAQEDNTTELGVFVKGKIIKGDLIIEPGFRAQYYASIAYISPEPRIGLKYNVADALRLKASAGMYSQNFLSATSDRDVVNLFYGFLSGPENLPEEFNGKKITDNLQKAEHVVFGFEYDILAFLELNVEGYVKYFNQLTTLNRNKLYDDNSGKPAYLQEDFIIETGMAKGIDVSLKWETKQFYLWAVYSLGAVTRDDSLMVYAPHYDRRHNANIVGTYKFGKHNCWELNARFNLGSGFPFTQVQGYYPQIDMSQGVTTDITKENATSIAIQDAEYNKGRLPLYHRLDLSLKRTVKISKNSKIDFNLSVINAYNQQNVFYKSKMTQKTVYQLPILPSLGINFSF